MGDGLNNKENRKKAKDKSVKSPSKVTIILFVFDRRSIWVVPTGIISGQQPGVVQ